MKEYFKVCLSTGEANNPFTTRKEMERLFAIFISHHGIEEDTVKFSQAITAAETAVIRAVECARLKGVSKSGRKHDIGYKRTTQGTRPMGLYGILPKKGSFKYDGYKEDI